jgi:exopolysaccharide biosynthesis protein
MALSLSLLLPCQTYGQVGTYDWSKAEELCPGIKRVEVTVSSPRKMVINAVQIDTATPGLKFYTTPRCSPWAENSTETQRQKTRDFIREYQETEKKLVVAINADAWNPWIPSEWYQETNRNLLGLAVSEGTLVSGGSGTPSLIVGENGTVSVATTSAGYDIRDIQTAVSGFGFCLSEGSPLPSGDDLHPRTGTGISQKGRYVYFMTIDGRQPDSEGATTEEVGSWHVHNRIPF